MTRFRRPKLLLHALLFFGILPFLAASISSERFPHLSFEHAHHYKRQNVSVTQNVSISQNVSSSALANARRLVEEAARQQGLHNDYRVTYPRLNKYWNSRSSEGKAYRAQRRDTEPAPPILDATLRAAAALIAEHDAAAMVANGTFHRVLPKPRFDTTSQSTKRSTWPDPSLYWVNEVEKNGLAPMGGSSSWKVYRDVTDPMFGAKGDGVTDDTAAINAAIAYGGNCGSGCNSSSVEGTFIFFPGGTYLISTPIECDYYTQLVGDPLNMPTIRTTPLFIGLGAIETDVYIPNASGAEWYIEQSNFFRQVRNFKIDIIDTTTAKVAGLHWQVAQATSLTNVRVFASTSTDTTAMGMYTENGSSGFMSDCFFSGGKYGIFGGNQQYTVRNFEFHSQTTAGICLIWDWGWTWSQLTVANSPIGILLINPQATTGQQAGSIYVLDSLFENVQTAIFANQLPATILESSVITLDNIGVVGVGTMLAFVDGTVYDLAPTDLDFLVIGNVEDGGSDYGMYVVSVNVPDSSMLDLSLPGYARPLYFSKPRPQYFDVQASDVVNVKDHGVMGDGSTDDTEAIQAVLGMATTNNLIYFPAGSYIVTSTLEVKPGSRITGQVWSQLVATGAVFGDMANPQVMLRVGASGDVGSIEISDMLFTSKGNLSGLVLVEWNIAADGQGDAGLWDCHFRIGGALGTELQVAQCPSTVPQIGIGCIAASMMLHITSGANGYFENMWAWVADHDMDDPSNAQVSVAVARGILVESQGPTWMLGTASEHAMLYQYNFFGSTNTLAGMIQTESPYFQYTEATTSPGPYNSSVGLFSNDPIFPDSTCDATDLLCSFSWAVMIGSTTNLSIPGAGLYSWYDNYDQLVCVDAQNCQQRLVNDQGGNDQLLIWNLVTIGSVEMISDTDTGNIIYAKNNTQAIAHPFWSILAAYADDFGTEAASCLDNDTSIECNTTPVCDFTLEFATLDNVTAAAGSYPDICTEYYALGAMANMLDTAVDGYTSANDGYDGIFGDYVTFSKQMIPTALQTFMAAPNSTWPAGGPGNKYFTCELSESGVVKIPNQPCPIPPKQFNYLTEYSMKWTIINETGFFDELQATYGIQPYWVDFTTVKTVVNCAANSGHETSRGCEPINISNVGFPTDSGNVTVTNPKDVFTNALPTIGTLQTQLQARQIELISGAWFGATDDLVQAMSMPVFMLTQALTDMDEVKQIGENEKAQLKKQLTWEILGIIFGLIPFLDELTPEIEGLSLILNFVAFAGNTAAAIQDIIADPTSAPMEILGLLTGGGGKDEAEISEMAATRRGISEEDIASIGTTFKKLDTDLQSAVGKTCNL